MLNIESTYPQRPYEDTHSLIHKIHNKLTVNLTGIFLIKTERPTLYIMNLKGHLISVAPRPTRYRHQK